MNRTIRRLVGSLFIISALILTQIPARLTQAASVAREDFLLDNQTLVKYTGTATTVSVSDDIKVIGEEAFANNQYVGIVNLGKNIKSIEHGAFANCNYLNRVVIPDSVNEIGSAAFSGCRGLKTIAIGNSVETLGDGVFAGCSNLAGIDIARNNNNLIFEAGVLYDNNKEHIYSYLSANPYNTFYMPNSVNNISAYSFWGNNQLEEVYLSSALEYIPAYSFSNCRNLKIVQIPYSVDSIDAKAFENCISLTDVVIPASVKYIDPTAFDGCYNLNIIAEVGTAAYDFFRNFDNSDIRNTEYQDVNDIVENIKHYEHSTYNEDVYTNDGYIDASQDPSNVEWMPSVNPLIKSEDSSVLGKTIVVGGRAVLFVDKEMEVNQLTNEELQQKIDEYNAISETGSIIYDSKKGGFIPKYSYIDDAIASQAFYASRNEEDFVIPSNTKHIGDFSFARSSISRVDIPQGVETIGYGAFYHCDNLAEVNIPGSVKEIEGYAFENTPYLNNFMSGNNGEFLIVGDGILLAYAGNSSEVNIPQGVKTISQGCFEDNTNIETVNLPNSLITIDSDAFRGCNNLSTVTGGVNVEHIRDRAFMNCPVSGFVVKDRVKTIGLRAFDFSNTNLDDNKKVIVFEGNELPIVDYDSTSSRLANYDYRQDALFNVLFAVVNSDVIVENTVLDSGKLGFSGVILSPDGPNAKIVNSYIYSEEVLDRLPNNVIVGTNEYLIDKDTIELSNNPYSSFNKSKNVTVLDDLDGFDVTAKFSEDESCSKLVVEKSEIGKNVLNHKYSEIFGGENIANLDAYEINLYDDKEIVKLDKLGKSSLYVTLPIAEKKDNVHVITLDEDGQLEEVPVSYNDNSNTVTFETTHLSYFGVYSNEDNVVLEYKDGKIVKNYKLDDSPNTGDKSIPVYYVISVALLCIGLIFILKKDKHKV